MAEEAEVPAQAAPETVATAAPVEAPVSGETKPAEEQAKPARTFTQEEVDALIGKRLARAKDSWQREQVRQQPQTEVKPEAPAAKPQPQSYASTEEYIEAVAEWKADQRIEAKLSDREKQQRESQSRQAQAQYQAQYVQKEAVARAQYSDFDDVVYDPSVPITDAMAFAIQTADRGPDLAYYLGKNPTEAARIARLSPFLQAKELGRLEAKLPENQVKTSSAPEPIKPLGGKGGSQPVYDTTDPRSTKHMSSSEWIDAENRRLTERYRAQGYR